MIADVSLKNKKVLIIGGGQQGVKNYHRMKEQQADVQVVSIAFQNDIDEKDRLVQRFEPSVIDRQFLVIAATNDAQVNHEIVRCANQKNILCASVHHDNAATFHFMSHENLPHLSVGLSTKAASPVYGKQMLKEIKDNYYQKHHLILEDLDQIRQYVLTHVSDNEKRSSFLRQLACEDKDWIFFLRNAVQKKKAVICYFHGNKKKCNHESILKFLTKIELPAYYAFYSATHYARDIETVKTVLKLLEVQVKYCCMTIYKGKIYEQMITKLKGEDVLCIHMEHDDIEAMRSYYEEKKLLVVTHDEIMKDLLISMKFSAMTLKEPLYSFDRKALRLVPLLLLYGSHAEKDIQRIFLQLKEKGIEVAVEKCLIEQDWYTDRMVKKIQNFVYQK